MSKVAGRHMGDGLSRSSSPQGYRLRIITGHTDRLYKAVESLYEVKMEKKNVISKAKQTAILMLIMANVLNQTVQLQIQVVQYGDLLPNWNIMRESRFLTFF